jgi:hypothetical protein
MTVAPGSVLEHRACSFSAAFFLASSSGSRARARPRRSARSRAARSLAAARRRRGVAVRLLPEARHLPFGLVQALLQGGLAVEGGGPRAGAHAHAVQGHAVEIDQALLAQHGDRVGQRAAEELGVGHAEVGEGVVVDGHAARPPAEGVVVGAQVVQGAGRADALQGGVQPQADADARVEGGVARPAQARADAVIEGGQVQADAEVPDEAGLVVRVEQLLPGHGRDELLAVHGAQGRRRSVRHEPPRTQTS